MNIGNVYSIKGSRLEYAHKNNMVLQDDMLIAHKKGSCYFMAIDSLMEHGKWGRFHMEYEHQEHMSIKVGIRTSDNEYLEDGYLVDDFLADDEIQAEEKESIFSSDNSICIENKRDILLYELSGRYMWMYISINCDSDMELIIKNIRIYQEGDNFINIFPEIYRERNSFFHRYLSVFSGMYYELQEKTEEFERNINVDTAPMEMLPILASWMGLDIHGDYMDEAAMRTIVREAYELNKKKGTKAALERVVSIVLGEKAIIKENVVENSDSELEITVLIHTDVEQNRKAGILYLLRQFKPVRASLKIDWLRQNGRIDENTYVDLNAAIMDGKNKCLDSNESYDNIKLQ